MSVQSSPENPVLGGIALAQYAAVNAAVSEGFLLDEVLAVERLTPSKWARGETMWQKQIVTDKQSLGQYELRLAEAEDRLTRGVDPLDDDVDAWVEFLRTWSNHGSPVELLAQHRLSTNDLARLRRRWTARLEQDKQLADRASELQQRASALKPLRITCAAPILRPSAHAMEAHVARSSPPLAAEPPHAVLAAEEIARLLSELDRPSIDRAAIYIQFGIASVAEGDVLLLDLEKRMTSDPVLRSDVRSLRAHLERQRAKDREPIAPHLEIGLPASARVASPVVAENAPRVPPPRQSGTERPLIHEHPAVSRERAIRVDDVNATAELRALPREPALPFTDTPAPEVKSDYAAARFQSRDPGDETMAVPALRALKPAVPFAQPSSPSAPHVYGPPVVDAFTDRRSIPQALPLPLSERKEPGPSPPAASKLSPPRRDPGDETSALPAIQLKAPLPFARIAAPQSAPSDFTGTTELRVGSSPPALPFSEASGGSPPLPASAPPKLPLPRRDAGDETLAVPAVLAFKSELPFTTRPAADLSPVPVLVDDPNALTLEQYASLCAELAVRQQPRDVVIKRYGIADEEGRKQQDVYWALRMRKNEPLKAKFKELLASFRQHLEGSRAR